ncbi:bifunctional 2',3'-cyclic-nucleotide 2'-phosphodiesterase/3'-nucleotidase [Rossellomorea sp. KS-H15a]|uniref:bifunctional 2',3'-cyclic-nucleotide 2'-phosphodiesterase/3'-nucleotidase n=1 Tax=Rossellomorea sp. KS-H15a TaxID=2963940 RepID=UPI0020C605AD|nr:bifunctional 2',3'-cyclic-nucleotide 2'-phosphodiesterase/3'-nucleotidase [Rossellomorea sp. KS-H15a]UTE77362.1 bifunctional 2',3'-cyclic-nucleotide 2'-phosphodiesterase/3'-nucleotidase [Rossellomorea sp. KS-H15a]
MKKPLTGKKKTLAGAALALGLIVPQAAPSITYAEVMDKDIVKLRILETTDIHVNLVNYDYYQDTATDKYGLAKTATLIKQARSESKNNLLFDNGDLIQGNPLGDYVAKEDPLQDGEIHPVYKAMNLLNYDAGNIGNHEFNYGLDFLGTSLGGSNFPYVNANVYEDDQDGNPDNDKNYFKPYEILDRTVVDEDGEEHAIKVGVIGFVPPQIMQWDKANLEGNVIAKDIIETANKFVPQMKAEGADVIVAIPHSGIGNVTQEGMEENATYDLSKVEGINAILFGHSHGVFPSESYAGIEGVDVKKGTINGVGSVMPGSWGDHLGLVDLELELKDGEWHVTNTQASTRSILNADGTPAVEADQAILDAVKEEHDATIEWVRSAVGETTSPINSYFALVSDDPSVQIVTNAQKWYVEKYIKGTEYDGIPVLSAGAPFKAGTRSNPDYYTDIPAGEIAIKNVSDLYLYPNTLQAVLLTGADVKEWLEMSAGQFNQIDPSKSEEQNLVNGDYRSYNFDVIDGVTYEIDVTQAPKYDAEGKLVNESSSRIKNLMFDGKPIDPDQSFIVATNNYRASGKFPGVKNSEIIIKSPDENRNVIIDYIMEKKTIDPKADGNWAFAPVKGNTNVVFETSLKAQDYIKDSSTYKFLGKQDSGFGKYSIKLKQSDATNPGQEKKFNDVDENHWARDYIYDLTQKNIIKGKTDTIFAPQSNVTRAQFAALIARTLDLHASNTNHFSDVSGDLTPEINAIFEAGITTGVSKGKFAPNQPITRQQMAAMLIRAYNYKTGKEFKATTSENYSDSKNIAPVFKENVNAAHELGFMTGHDDGRFGPLEKASRAQAAKTIYMLLNK